MSGGEVNCNGALFRSLAVVHRNLEIGLFRNDDCSDVEDSAECSEFKVTCIGSGLCDSSKERLPVSKRLICGPLLAVCLPLWTISVLIALDMRDGPRSQLVRMGQLFSFVFPYPTKGGLESVEQAVTVLWLWAQGGSLRHWPLCCAVALCIAGRLL